MDKVCELTHTTFDPAYFIDENMTLQVKNTAIALAIVSFYLLDFALNALQASLRNLLLDVTPPEQLNAGNAWHSRMLNAGNIVGYGFGMDEHWSAIAILWLMTVQDSFLLQSCLFCVCLVVTNFANFALLA